MQHMSRLPLLLPANRCLVFWMVMQPTSASLSPFIITSQCSVLPVNMTQPTSASLPPFVLSSQCSVLPVNRPMQTHTSALEMQFNMQKKSVTSPQVLKRRPSPDISDLLITTQTHPRPGIELAMGPACPCAYLRSSSFSPLSSRGSTLSLQRRLAITARLPGGEHISLEENTLFCHGHCD